MRGAPQEIIRIVDSRENYDDDDDDDVVTTRLRGFFLASAGQEIRVAAAWAIALLMCCLELCPPRTQFEQPCMGFFMWICRDCNAQTRYLLAGYTQLDE